MVRRKRFRASKRRPPDTGDGISCSSFYRFFRWDSYGFGGCRADAAIKRRGVCRPPDVCAPFLTMRLGCWTGFRNAILLLLTGAVIALLSGCHAASKFPEKNSKAYADVVSAFYVGLSALQVGDDVHAETKLAEVTHLVPGEPAGWANWGILALRQRNYDAAAQRLQKAQELAPNNDQIYSLMGLMESQRGNSGQALTDLRKAVELNPQNLRATYQLAEETERQGASDGEMQF